MNAFPFHVNVSVLVSEFCKRQINLLARFQGVTIDVERNVYQGLGR